jgi:hypothetical protein
MGRGGRVIARTLYLLFVFVQEGPDERNLYLLVVFIFCPLLV